MPEPGGGDENELLCAGKALDQPFQLKGAAPGSDPAGPGEGHRATRASEFRCRARSVFAETPEDILGGAGVQRPITATKDVDKRHRGSHGRQHRMEGTWGFRIGDTPPGVAAVPTGRASGAAAEALRVAGASTGRDLLAISRGRGGD